MIEAGARARLALRRASGKVLVEVAGAGVRRTGDTLLMRAECLAGELVDQGHARRVLVLHFSNSAAAFEAFIAAELVAATRVPVDKNASPDEVLRIARAAGASLILTDNHALATLGDQTRDRDRRTTRSALPVWRYDDTCPVTSLPWRGSLFVEPGQTLVRYPRSVVGDGLRSADTSYANWDAILATNIELYASGSYGPQIADDDGLVTSVGLMHFSGMVGSWPFLLLGLPQVVLRKFDPATVLSALEDGVATTLVAVPKMLSRIAQLLIADAGDRGQRPRTPSRHAEGIRRILYGGAPVPGSDLRRNVEVFGETLCQLYGSYEAGWPLTILSPHDHIEAARTGRRMTSCGRAHPHVELMVRDGALTAKSAMSSPRSTDADGWCRLDDHAAIDDEGYVELLGRTDAMINTGGFHVFPAEVTEALLGLEGVTGALVRGESDADWGQSVTAYITGPAGADIPAVRSQLQRALASYKVPRRIHHVTELPR